MTEYRRAHIPGTSWFFTVNLAERHGNRLLADHIDLLWRVFREVKHRHRFAINAMVVLPEHLNCIWTPRRVVLTMRIDGLRSRQYVRYFFVI